MSNEKITIVVGIRGGHEIILVFRSKNAEEKSDRYYKELTGHGGSAPSISLSAEGGRARILIDGTRYDDICIMRHSISYVGKYVWENYDSGI